MKILFDKVSYDCSKLTTKRYSTSFSLGIRFLAKPYRKPIYNIYGFVRFADEIVDSFHAFDKEMLLNRFEENAYQAIQEKISLNPILNSFQETVHEFNIPKELIAAFLTSMRMDLQKQSYTPEEYKTYILGSAEVVGLMCLKVFCNGDSNSYEKLKSKAQALGSAFQKINFLRDMHDDVQKLGRMYFPGIDFNDFNEQTKKSLIEDIEIDFKKGLEGIRELPKGSRFGVYMAYVYYHSLLKKIKKTPSKTIMNQRVRISDNIKYALFVSSLVRHQLNLI